jgi:hypothetical protein
MKRTKVRRKTKKRRSSSRSSKSIFIQPQSVEEFFALSEQDQDLWKNGVQVVTEVRVGASLRRASLKVGLDPRKVRQLVRPALRKRRNGRWAAKKYDRLLRILPLPSRKGLIEVATRDSRQATIVGKYWNAVDLYSNTGDASALEQFQGEHVTDAEGNPVPLLTDLHELDRLGSAGVLSFETIYARIA